MRRKVKLKVRNLEKLFSGFKGQVIRLESDKPMIGWVRLSVGNSLSYDLNLSARYVERNAPVIVRPESLPSMNSVLREVVFVIAQLRDLTVPVDYIQFTVGKAGIPYLCGEKDEYHIEF